jgi:transposase InsO family protein
MSTGSSRSATRCSSPRRRTTPSRRARPIRLHARDATRRRAAGRDPPHSRAQRRHLRRRESVAPAASRGHAGGALHGRAADAKRARQRRTTSPDDRGPRPRDLVDRDFTAEAPNRLWVSDFTYVMTWSGVVYVAFVIDAFSRRIVGWKADASMRTELVLDTLEMALWSRDRDGIPRADGMISHSDAGSQYTSFAFTTRLVDADVDRPSARSATRTTTRWPKRRSGSTRPRRSTAAAPGARCLTSSLRPSSGSTGTTTSGCTLRATGGLRPSLNLSISIN